MSTPGPDFHAGRVLRAARAPEPGIPGRPPPPRRRLTHADLSDGVVLPSGRALTACVPGPVFSPQKSEHSLLPPDPQEARRGPGGWQGSQVLGDGIQGRVSNLHKGTPPKVAPGEGGSRLCLWSKGRTRLHPTSVIGPAPPARQQSCPLVKLGASPFSSLRAAASRAVGCVPGSPALRTQRGPRHLSSLSVNTQTRQRGRCDDVTAWHEGAPGAAPLPSPPREETPGRRVPGAPRDWLRNLPSLGAGGVSSLNAPPPHCHCGPSGFVGTVTLPSPPCCRKSLVDLVKWQIKSNLMW